MRKGLHVVVSIILIALLYSTHFLSKVCFFIGFSSEIHFVKKWLDMEYIDQCYHFNLYRSTKCPLIDGQSHSEENWKTLLIDQNLHEERHWNDMAWKISWEISWQRAHKRNTPLAFNLTKSFSLKFSEWLFYCTFFESLRQDSDDIIRCLNYSLPNLMWNGVN